MPQRLPDSDADLLALYVAVLDELKARAITRTNNLPTGDYAEKLVKDKLGGVLEPNSAKGWDLLMTDGTRVQIKARRADKNGGYGGFSALRSLAESEHHQRSFDVLVAVVFNYDYSVGSAWWIPWQAVKDHAGYSTTWKAARLGRIAGPITEAAGVKALELI